MELKDTAKGMESGDYRERMLAEWQQTRIRYEKLKDFNYRIREARRRGEEGPPHDCPLKLLRKQQRCMGLYLRCLEERAALEKVKLELEEKKA